MNKKDITKAEVKGITVKLRTQWNIDCAKLGLTRAQWIEKHLQCKKNSHEERNII